MCADYVGVTPGGSGGYNSSVAEVNGGEVVSFTVAPCCPSGGTGGNTIVLADALSVFMNVTGGTAGTSAGPVNDDHGGE